MKKILILSFIFICLFCYCSVAVMAEETIKIGAIFARKGDASDDGGNSLKGLKYAVDEINGKGGVLGKKLEVIVFDNRSSSIGSKAAAEQAVKSNVVAVIGPSWSSNALSIAPILQAHKIPMITSTATNPNVTTIGDYIFRVCFIDSFQGKAMAKFVLSDLKVKTAALLIKVSSDYSVGLADEFRNNFVTMGGDIVHEAKYIQSDKDYKDILESVREKNPDVIFIPGHNESGSIIRQAQDMGIKSIFVGGDGWGGNAFYTMGGNETLEGYYSTHWSEQVDSDNARAFIEKYGKAGRITSDTVLSYDAVNILVDAIERAGAADRERVQKELTKVKNFKGVTGDITFNDIGDPIKSIIIIGVKNGENQYLKSFEPEVDK